MGLPTLLEIDKEVGSLLSRNQALKNECPRPGFSLASKVTDPRVGKSSGVATIRIESTHFNIYLFALHISDLSLASSTFFLS